MDGKWGIKMMAEVSAPRVPEKTSADVSGNRSFDPRKPIDCTQNPEVKSSSAFDPRKPIDVTGSKDRVQKEKGEFAFSEKIESYIKSKEERTIYKNADLQEKTVGDKLCLVRNNNDIDWKQKDPFGRTNYERTIQGLSPFNKDNKVIELHHIGQSPNSQLAELTPEEHRGRGTDSILHDKTCVSTIDREQFAKERAEHWKTRAAESEGI